MKRSSSKVIAGFLLGATLAGGVATAATSEPLGVKVCVDKKSQAIFLAGSNGCSTSRTSMTLGAPTIDVKSIASLVTPSVVSIKVVAAGGTGTGSGAWGLNGRRLASPGAVKAECNDEGTVVVEVKVNKNGAVTNAKFSLSGSNTTSKCLQDAAIKSAYKYKWNDDSNAPDNQIGFIVFNFRNGE